MSDAVAGHFLFQDFGTVSGEELLFDFLPEKSLLDVLDELIEDLDNICILLKNRETEPLIRAMLVVLEKAQLYYFLSIIYQDYVHPIFVHVNRNEELVWRLPNIIRDVVLASLKEKRDKLPALFLAQIKSNKNEGEE